MGPRDGSDVAISFPLAQKLLPQTDGRPGDPQSHLSPLRRLERVLAEECLLPALRQREHRHLRAGDGQARHQVAAQPRPHRPAGVGGRAESQEQVLFFKSREER